MRILISNDDGIHAKGLQVLAETLHEIGKVVVVAPDREQSGTGHSITVHRPLRVEKTKISGLDIEAWALDGTPSDCVKLAIEDLLSEPPDIVVSGINSGPNLGTDVLYSGTVSAAIEGAINGFTSVAVSLASYSYRNFKPSGIFLRNFISRFEKNGLPRGALININVPGVERPLGVKVTHLGDRRYVNIFEKRVDPRGRAYYWMAGEPLETENTVGTDVEAIKENYISITPLHFDLTDYVALEQLKLFM